MNSEQMTAAKTAMIEWLAHPQELGKAPSKIECAGEFDLHDLHYYIFKYKKGLLGKWLVGVCGGYEENDLNHCGHVFSDMQPYVESTAKDECIKMVEFIRSYWMEQAKNAANNGRQGGLSDEMYLYTEEEINEYEAYIQKSLGEYQDVFHEIVSPDIHLDVIIVPPTEEAPFYKLVTMGMGAYAMNVPEELKKDYNLEHAELMLFLPADWDIRSTEEKNYWPIRQLKALGRLPIQCDTWLGFGHTVHANADFAPVAENTGFNSFVLLSACDITMQPMELTLSSGRKINFYQLFPLYQEEVDFKLSHSLDELIDKFADEALDPVININRKNACK